MYVTVSAQVLRLKGILKEFSVTPFMNYLDCLSKFINVHKLAKSSSICGKTVKLNI